MIHSSDIGLADWHTHTHRDGSATLLRQSLTRLALISDRGPGAVGVRLYSDPHGMDLCGDATLASRESAQWVADRWLGLATYEGAQ